MAKAAKYRDETLLVLSNDELGLIASLIGSVEGDDTLDALRIGLWEVLVAKGIDARWEQFLTPENIEVEWVETENDT